MAHLTIQEKLLTIPDEPLLEKQDATGLPVNPAFQNEGRTTMPRAGLFRLC